MKKGPGNQHCSDLSATLPLSRFQRQLPLREGSRGKLLGDVELELHNISVGHDVVAAFLT